MTIQKKVRRLVLIGTAAAAVAAPAAGAGVMPGQYVQINGQLVNPAHLSEYEAQIGSPRSAHLVQIGGKLVAPDKVSAFQAHAGQTPVGAHLVQIGGKLVRPDRLSAYQAHAGDLNVSKASSHGDGIGWTTTGIGIGVFASLLLLAGTFGALWRRGRLSTV
jgi:hypothetical protein